MRFQNLLEKFNCEVEKKATVKMGKKRNMHKKRAAGTLVKKKRKTDKGADVPSTSRSDGSGSESDSGSAEIRLAPAESVEVCMPFCALDF